MVRAIVRVSLALLTAGLIQLAIMEASQATVIRQKIMNDAGAANDLTIVSSTAIKTARFRNDDDGDGKLEPDEETEDATSITPAGNPRTAKWIAGDIKNR